MLSADLTYRRPISEVRGHRMPSTISKAALHLSWLGWLGWEEQWATCDCDSLLGAKVEVS